MKVCVDIQAAVTQQAGIGRYTRLLVEHLAAVAEDTLRLVYFDFNRRAMPFHVVGTESRAVRWCPGSVAETAWQWLKWPPYERFAGPADVYHFPNFLLPPLRRGKSVVTVHDMSFIRHPEYAEERNCRYLSAHIHDTARRVDAVITDSEFSAQEIRELLPVAPEQVHPIHLGISERFRPAPPEQVAAVKQRLELDRPYLLTVGTLEPRKNIPFLIDVFETLTDFDGLFVIAGMRGWKCDPIHARIRQSPRAAEVRYLEFVADEDLCALYSGAELFLIGSFYEGFGFPPLEAMACGVPVLSSPAGSLVEVLGDAAVIPGDFDPEHWAEEARRLLCDGSERQRRIAGGRARAARFRWGDTARETWRVYRTVCGP